MRIRPFERQAALIAAGSIAFAAMLSAQPGAPSLRIVITNDDGYRAAGLEAVRNALIAAGHDVSVVAPLDDHSGAGASMTTSGTLKVEPKGAGVWAVHGTPADASLIAVRHLFRERPPDLVVSGINRGQNLGTSSNSSGTVGAAIVAAQAGIPAIAVSAGLVPGSRPPNAAAFLTQAYQDAAQVTTELVAALMAARAPGARLLPDRIVININVPAPTSGRVAGIRVAPLSRRGSFAREYQATATTDEVRAGIVAVSPAPDEGDTDLSLFARGFVTLTVLDGDWSVPVGTAGAELAARLAALKVPAAKR